MITGLFIRNADLLQLRDDLFAQLPRLEHFGMLAEAEDPAPDLLGAVQLERGASGSESNLALPRLSPRQSPTLSQVDQALQQFSLGYLTQLSTHVFQKWVPQFGVAENSVEKAAMLSGEIVVDLRYGLVVHVLSSLCQCAIRSDSMISLSRACPRLSVLRAVPSRTKSERAIADSDMPSK
jgi:hypothetical protein